MPAHPDILAENEQWKKPLAGSVLLHGGLAAIIIAYAWVNSRPRETFGDPNSLGGGGVSITPVSKLPLPSRTGRVNPVANDTESQVPLPPKELKQKERTPREDPDAIALKMKRTKRTQADVAASNQRYRNQEDRPNQLYTTGGQAAVSPMFGGQSGSGGVGVGNGTPFGTRFGWYAELLRQRIAEKWKPNDDPSARSTPPVIVTFEIARDGSISNVRIAQRSGNLSLDYSAQRAVQEAAPFPQLPREFDRNSANVEFWFQLKR